MTRSIDDMTAPELDKFIARLERGEIEACAPQWGQGLLLAYLWACNRRSKLANAK